MAAPMKMVLHPESGSYVASLSQLVPNVSALEIYAESTVQSEPRSRFALERDAVRSILAERALKALEVARAEAETKDIHREQVSSAQIARCGNSATISRPPQGLAPSAPDINQAYLLNALAKLAAQQKSRAQVEQRKTGGFMQHFSDADAMEPGVGCAVEPNYFPSAEHTMLKGRALKAFGSAKPQAPTRQSDSKLRGARQGRAPALNVNRDCLLEALEKIASRKSADHKSRREVGLHADRSTQFLSEVDTMAIEGVRAEQFELNSPCVAKQTMLAECNIRAPPGLSLGQGPQYGMSRAPTQVISAQTANCGIPNVKRTHQAAMFQIKEEDERSSTNCDDCGETDSSEAGSSAEHANIMSDLTPHPMTTLMIRNVPVMYTQDMLLLEWPNDGTYDILYSPYSSALHRNLSYAFINFISEEAALAFTERWQKKRLNHFTARKPLNISFADAQGRDSNLIQFRKKGVGRIKVSQCQPMIFENGQRVPLTMALAHL